MRDGALHQMQAANAKRSALLLGQFEFLQTRQEAFERVLKVSRWHDRLRWAVQPALLLALVDAVQNNLLELHRSQLQEQALKTHIQRVPA